MSRRKVIVNLSQGVFALGGVTCLFDQIYGEPEEFTLEGYNTTLKKASVTVAGIFLYYILCTSVCMCLPRRFRVRRNPVSHGDYRDTSMDTADLIGGAPRLTMNNIWVMVYGLGAFLFIFCAVFAGGQPVTMYSFTLGLILACFQELASSNWHADPVRHGVYTVITLFVSISVLLVLIDSGESIASKDVTIVAGGVIIPILSPVVLFGIKYKPVYSLGSVAEMCEFALPFMCIVAGVISLVDGPYEIRIEQTTITAAILAPLLMVPAMFVLISAALENRILDPLIVVALILSVKHLLANVENSMALCSLILVTVAMTSRLYSCEDKKQEAPPEYSVEEVGNG